jgi:hypothetical protein
MPLKLQPALLYIVSVNRLTTAPWRLRLISSDKRCVGNLARISQARLTQEWRLTSGLSSLGGDFGIAAATFPWGWEINPG